MITLANEIGLLSESTTLPEIEDSCAKTIEDIARHTREK